MVKSFPLPYPLYSSPLAWPIGAAPGFGFAVVLGDRRATETAGFVVGFDPSGRPLPGFPWLRSSPSSLAPGNSLVMATPRGDLLAIDLQGQARLLRDGHEAAAGPLNAALGLLAAAAVEIGSPAQAWVLLSRDMRPHGESRNAIAVLSQGRLLAGFPLALSGVPETQPPCVDAAGERAFVMLRTGQVDGFSLTRGQRLPGFPTAALSAPRPIGGFRLALSRDGGTALIASGALGLTRIDSANPRPAKPAVLQVGARALAALVADGRGGMVGWDAASGALVAFDLSGREQSALALAPVYGEVAPFLVASAGSIAVVGVESTDTRARVDQLFAERAPAPVKALLPELAAEEAQVRYGGVSRLNAAQQLEVQADLNSLKKGWLEKTYGLAVVDAALRVVAATRVSVVQVAPNQPLRLLLEDRIEGYSPDTGFSQCEHVLPVFWRDPRQPVSQLLVGLNAVDLPPGKAAPASPAQLRAYPLPVA